MASGAVPVTVPTVSEVVDLSGIALEVAAHLDQGVTTKFLQKSIGEDKCHHGFRGDGTGGNDAPVGTLISGLDGFLSDHIGGAQGAAECGDWLQVAAHDDVFAIGDAAFEAAGAIGRARKFLRGLVVENFVLDFAAETARSENAGADFNTFYGLDAHYGLRKFAVESFIPLGVRAEADGNVVGDDFKNAADSVACFQNGVDFGFHFFLCCGVDAAERGF